MMEIFLLYGDDVSKTTIEIFDKLSVHFLGKINFLEMHFKILPSLCYDSWKSIGKRIKISAKKNIFFISSLCNEVNNLDIEFKFCQKINRRSV